MKDDVSNMYANFINETDKKILFIKKRWGLLSFEVTFKLFFSV